MFSLWIKRNQALTKVAILSFFFAAMGTGTLSATLDKQHSALPPLPADAEVLYLPNGKALERLSLGYRNMLGDLLWFKTISYFGAHYRADKQYTWLYHMCTLVTTLDAQAKDVYRFCGTMLAWEVTSVHESNDIYTRAITRFPQDWIFYYLRGFNYLYFLKDQSKAQQDFITAAKLPHVHPLVAALAVKSTKELESPEVAETMLRSLIASAPSEEVRAALMKQLEQLHKK